MKLKNTKQVEYFGIKLHISDNFSFLAVDQDGELYSFVEKPEISPGGDWWDNYGVSKLIADVDLEGVDWKESLKLI